jgi:hypothetical protein
VALLTKVVLCENVSDRSKTQCSNVPESHPIGIDAYRPASSHQEIFDQCQLS